MEASGNVIVGVDVGGTKILAAVISLSGQVLKRYRQPTPREVLPEEVLESIMDAIDGALDKAGVQASDVVGIGLAVPGVIDFQEGRVDAAPNIAIAGPNLVEPIRQRFGAPVALGNDTDTCALGERWMGSARDARSAIGIFVGTGIGGGIFVNGHLIRGPRYSAAEVGHMIVQMGGPKCGCGSRGCLEAIASRTAIERELCKAMADDKKTVLHDLLDGDEAVIRSGVLRKALKAEDSLTTKVLRSAAEALGVGCVSLGHLFDPDVIILGGGVIEACGDFYMPIVQQAIDDAPYFSSRGPENRLVQSALGDDAGLLGAAALALEEAGIDPFDRQARPAPRYPDVLFESDGTILAGGDRYDGDLLVRVNGKTKARGKGKKKKQQLASVRKLSAKDLRRACKGGPELLIIGAADAMDGELPAEARTYLDRRRISSRLLPPTDAVETFRREMGRKALLLLTG